MAQEPPYLFFSTNCKYCEKLIGQIQLIPALAKAIKAINIEVASNLPPDLKSVPALMINGNLLVGTRAFEWVASIIAQQQPNQQQPPITQNMQQPFPSQQQQGQQQQRGQPQQQQFPPQQQQQQQFPPQQQAAPAPGGFLPVDAASGGAFSFIDSGEPGGGSSSSPRFSSIDTISTQQQFPQQSAPLQTQAQQGGHPHYQSQQGGGRMKADELTRLQEAQAADRAQYQPPARQ